MISAASIPAGRRVERTTKPSRAALPAKLMRGQRGPSGSNLKDSPMLSNKWPSPEPVSVLLADRRSNSIHRKVGGCRTFHEVISEPVDAGNGFTVSISKSGDGRPASDISPSLSFLRDRST